MKNLDWKAGFRRAAIFVLLYMAILYVMGTFIDRLRVTQEEIPEIAINAVLFFFILSLFFAWSEPRRKKRMAELQARRQGKQPKQEDEDSEPSAFKGKPNPNTSRKKSRRRR